MLRPQVLPPVVTGGGGCWGGTGRNKTMRHFPKHDSHTPRCHVAVRSRGVHARFTSIAELPAGTLLTTALPNMSFPTATKHTSNLSETTLSSRGPW